MKDLQLASHMEVDGSLIEGVCACSLGLDPLRASACVYY